MEQEKLYFADLGIYVNCHICDRKTLSFRASSDKEANAIADEMADLMTKALAKEHGGDADYWVDVEDVYL